MQSSIPHRAGVWKHRPIDDGHRSKVNESMCARLIAQEADELGVDIETAQLTSGGEDLADGYRRVPVNSNKLQYNAVAFRVPSG